jgi:alkylhydroperoxidase family enzyme
VRPSRLTTPRIAPKDPSTWTDADSTLAATYSTDGGRNNAFRTLLNHPEMVKGILPVTNYLGRDSGLAPREREILILRTAWLTQSDYLWGYHSQAGSQAGLSDDEIRRIAQGADAPGWHPFEAALVRAADEMYLNGMIATPSWNVLAARYSTPQLIDVTFTIAQYTLVGGALNSMGVQPVPASGPPLPKLPDLPYRVSVAPREPAPTSPRIAPLQWSDMTPAVKAMVDPTNTQGANGLYRAIVRNPKIYPVRHLQSEHIRLRATLSTYQRELLILRSAWHVRGEYPWAQHVGNGRRAGLDTPKIAIGPDAPGWSPLDKALLNAADDLYRQDMVSDATWNAMIAGGLNTQQLMDVLVTAGGYRIVGEVGSTFGLPLEPKAERFPVLSSQ